MSRERKGTSRTESENTGLIFVGSDQNNLASQDASDIQIEGLHKGHHDKVTVTSGRHKKHYSFNWNSHNKSQVETFVGDVLRGIDQLRERTERKAAGGARRS